MGEGSGVREITDTNTAHQTTNIEHRFSTKNFFWQNKPNFTLTT
jgi:hypothetical protein